MIRLPRRVVQLTLIGLCVGIALAATAQRAIRIFLPSGWGLEPAGDPTPIGDMLAGGVPSPNGAWLAFASVGQGVHKAYVVRRDNGHVVDTVAIGQGGSVWDGHHYQLT